ncbi:hypothetical protein FQZ97_1062840 [compost metagenome]
MARRVHHSALLYVSAYAQCVLQNVLQALADLPLQAGSHSGRWSVRGCIPTLERGNYGGTCRSELAREPPFASKLAPTGSGAALDVGASGKNV